MGEVIQMGGCGKKCLQIIEGKADYYLHLDNKTKKWDTCAGEAIIGCLGGLIHDLNNEKYEYI